MCAKYSVKLNGLWRLIISRAIYKNIQKVRTRNICIFKILVTLSHLFATKLLDQINWNSILIFLATFILIKSYYFHIIPQLVGSSSRAWVARCSSHFPGACRFNTRRGELSHFTQFGTQSVLVCTSTVGLPGSRVDEIEHVL